MPKRLHNFIKTQNTKHPLHIIHQKRQNKLTHNLLHHPKQQIRPITPKLYRPKRMLRQTLTTIQLFQTHKKLKPHHLTHSNLTTHPPPNTLPTNRPTPNNHLPPPKRATKNFAPQHLTKQRSHPTLLR